MKPRNKMQRSVVELSATLPTLRPTDSEWIDTDFRTRWKNKGLCYYVIAERKASWKVLRWYYKSRKRKFEVMQIWLDGKSEVVLARKRFMLRNMALNGSGVLYIYNAVEVRISNRITAHY